MSLFNSLTKRSCPVCNSSDDSNIIYKENIDTLKLDQLAFASRKIPEFMNLRLVCCPTCDLLYAPLVPEQESLQNAYETTDYDSNEEANLAANTYAKWLPKIISTLPDKHSALDVGTGNGAFLTHLLSNGFQEVIGIEPSHKAISSAPDSLKKHIHAGMFNDKDFPSNHYSLICIFQTLEHIDQPAKFFQDAYQLLKPGGAIMLVAHNYRHWLMRLLGQKSPIIDIEHLQLFSPESLRFSLQKTGFKNIQMNSLRNDYPLHYWSKLLPMPRNLKTRLLNFLKNGKGRTIGSINIGMKVGNLITWAYK